MCGLFLSDPESMSIKLFAVMDRNCFFMSEFRLGVNLILGFFCYLSRWTEDQKASANSI
jgi:hypothetical protein